MIRLAAASINIPRSGFDPVARLAAARVLPALLFSLRLPALPAA